MHRVTNRRVRSSGVGGKLNVLLNNAVQGCPAVQEGQRPIVLLLHVVVLVDDLRVDVGDYVDGVLLRQALRGERDLEVDILRRDGGQSQGHQCVEEVVTIEAVEGGRHRRAWARGLEAYVKVVHELLDDGELVEEADEASSNKEMKLSSKRPLALAASSTTWRCSSVSGRRPASWTIWHSRLMLALIASMGLASSQLILRLE